MTTFIFDLDGVIVDTAKYHYLAWKNLAEELEITFTQKDNERLKGVSRIRSLEIILELGNKTLSKAEFEDYLSQKNEDYLGYIAQMKETEILPGVLETLKFLQSKNKKIALGSASKNAKTILEKINLSAYFDVIIDGNQVTKGKPDPQVFLLGAEKTNSDPQNCVVFEDAISGIQAANAAGMFSIGIGSKNTLAESNVVFSGIDEISNDYLENLS